MTRRIDLARWQPHVEEARRRGMTLKAYAAEEGVSLYSLYGASQVLRRTATPVASKRARGSSFARVRVISPPTVHATPLRLAAQLPNGVSVHVEGDRAELACVIAALGALPCSA